MTVLKAHITGANRVEITSAIRIVLGAEDNLFVSGVSLKNSSAVRIAKVSFPKKMLSSFTITLCAKSVKVNILKNANYAENPLKKMNWKAFLKKTNAWTSVLTV